MKSRGALPLTVGCVLIAASLACGLFFGVRTHLGSEKSRDRAAKIIAMLPPGTQGVPGSDPDAVMPMLEVDGVDYVAVLEIPGFDVTLPVTAQWDSRALSQAPALFWGSPYGDTLVIGGADGSSQFSFCSRIGHGDRITVTDMTGAEFAYTVSEIDRSKHAQTSWLTEVDCPLTLFCHDRYAMEYIAVRCDFAYN